MRGILLVLFCLLPMAASAITVEVVRLFQPISLHGTDGAGEEDDDDVLQAAVMSRPMALSGAIPEDLVKAVGDPCKIASNSPAYAVEEANLLLICRIGLSVEMLEEQRLLVRLDVSKLRMPEEVDLTARQVLTLTIKAIRRTLESYYAHSEERIPWEVRITGTNEKNRSLKNLSAKFVVGE